jgi:hypothetical protein
MNLLELTAVRGERVGGVVFLRDEQWRPATSRSRARELDCLVDGQLLTLAAELEHTILAALGHELLTCLCSCSRALDARVGGGPEPAREPLAPTLTPPLAAPARIPAWPRRCSAGAR